MCTLLSQPAEIMFYFSPAMEGDLEFFAKHGGRDLIIKISLPADDEVAYSGDLGSAVGWEDEEEKEAEETVEEAEEEEGEAGEVDDGGYIW